MTSAVIQGGKIGGVSMEMVMLVSGKHVEDDIFSTDRGIFRFVDWTSREDPLDIPCKVTASS